MEAKKLSSKRTLAILLLAIGCVGLVLGILGLVGEGGMDPYDARNGIAMVYATVYDNQGNSESGSGTGWAVGKPGKPGINVTYGVCDGEMHDWHNRARCLFNILPMLSDHMNGTDLKENRHKHGHHH